jgi:aryl-alcohol dehydrogenase-like predicted oxidoreductase
LVHRGTEAEVIPACERFGVGQLPYFPLASGLLTGKYRRDSPPPPGSRLAGDLWARRHADAPWDLIERLERYARDRSLTILDVAIGGLAAKPAVTSVIAGATTPDQVRANAAAGSWTPSAEDLAELDAITKRQE